jgi:hypothetical protein
MNNKLREERENLIKQNNLIEEDFEECNTSLKMEEIILPTI